MLLQHREYHLAPGSTEAFVDAWRRAVVPLRARFGFVVVSAWVSADGERFIWVVGHADDFEQAEASYYADPARLTMDPDPSSMVLDARVGMVRPVV
ncbi:MAG: NIPSNAP family protein [Actinomycetota bacterium]|nr:NIPSNAP family protein [Actinomycetota bacterium]